MYYHDIILLFCRHTIAHYMLSIYFACFQHIDYVDQKRCCKKDTSCNIENIRYYFPSVVTRTESVIERKPYKRIYDT